MVVGQASTGPLAAPVGRACEAVGACGHDVVVLMQLASDARTYAFECVAPPPHGDAAPLEQERGVVALGVGGLADGLCERGRGRKVTEAVHLVQRRRQGRCRRVRRRLRPQRPAGLELAELGGRVRLTEPLQAELADRLLRAWHAVCVG